MKKLTQKAFTLIELMIVIAILGILFAFVVPKLMDSSRNNTIKNDKQLEQTIDLNKDQDSGSKL